MSERIQTPSIPRTPVLPVSVVVLNHNRRDSLLRCLDSLLDLDPAPLEIIVVDNASTDGGPDLVVQRYADRVRLIERSENSVTAARNQGFRACGGEILLSLDNDTVLPDRGILRKIIETFQSHPEAGLLAFRIASPENPHEHQSEHWWHPLRQEESEKAPFWTPYFPEAAAAIRREAFLATGGYDEDFFMGGEQLDLSLSLMREGYRVLYVPDLIAIEEDVRGPLAGRDLPLHFLNLRNKLWTAWKHFPAGPALRYGVGWILAEGLRAARHGYLGSWGRALIAGVLAPYAIRARRNPLSKETWRTYGAVRKGILMEPSGKGNGS